MPVNCLLDEALLGAPMTRGAGLPPGLALGRFLRRTARTAGSSGAATAGVGSVIRTTSPAAAAVSSGSAIGRFSHGSRRPGGRELFAEF